MRLMWHKRDGKSLANSIQIIGSKWFKQFILLNPFEISESGDGAPSPHRKARWHHSAERAPCSRSWRQSSSNKIGRFPSHGVTPSHNPFRTMALLGIPWDLETPMTDVPVHVQLTDVYDIWLDVPGRLHSQVGAGNCRLLSEFVSGSTSKNDSRKNRKRDKGGKTQVLGTWKVEISGTWYTSHGFTSPETSHPCLVCFGQPRLLHQVQS